MARRRVNRNDNVLAGIFCCGLAGYWLRHAPIKIWADGVVALGICVVLILLYLWWTGRHDAAYWTKLRSRGIADPLALSSLEYEEFCALLLRQQGWRTTLTRSSGDFGADILAKRGGRSIAIQCKRYAKPVGVKAVQEVYAAKPYYGMQRAMVMSSSGFTRAARDLAEKTGTALIVVGRGAPPRI